MTNGKTVIVTGGSRGIGAAIVQAFLERGYNVVASSRSVFKAGYSASPKLTPVDGDISREETAEEMAKTAIETFGSIDHVANNAGIYSSTPFTEYTAEELHAFVSTNLDGFVFIAQLAVRQVLAQDRGGSVASISASLADNPIAGFRHQWHQFR
jgi:NAD(P)-dependent dehydrogenase (short-subunit alcohol dehydrogenase family)